MNKTNNDKLPTKAQTLRKNMTKEERLIWYEFLKNLPIDADRGYLLVDENMDTNIKGIYACGDIRKKQLRQVVTAVSDGAIASQHIFHVLMEKYELVEKLILFL